MDEHDDNLISEEPEKSVLKEEENYPTAKRFLPTPCAACLGILQDKCDEIISKVSATFKKFSKTLIFPICRFL